MGNPFDTPSPPKDTSALEAELTQAKQELKDSKDREQQLLDQLLVSPTPPAHPAETPPKPATPPAESPKPAPDEGDLETLVIGARTLVRTEHPDFDRYASEIDNIVARMEPKLRKQYRVWLEVYFSVMGRHVNDLIASDRTARATPSPSERPTATPTPVAEDHVTDPVEHDMMTKLGFTEKQWIERRKQMKEGQWELNLG